MRRWVGTRRILLLWAALALAALIALLPPGGAAAEGITTTLGRHFVSNAGAPQFVIGVNYVGHADRSWTMWEDAWFDPNVIGSDLSLAAAAGASVVRIFIRNPLPREIAANRWNKLDAIVALAKQRDIRLIVTFHDYAETDLAKASSMISAIASHYAGEPAIFGYDLQNEPHFSDLLSSQYPNGTSPLLSHALIKAYGERATKAQVNAWRQTDEGRAILPARFSEDEAYYGANAYRIYRELIAAIGDWVVARNYSVGTLDYLASPDAARWQPLLGVLDATLGAWLQPQLAALRAVDPAHLVTVGYSDQVLAWLPANISLGFASLHKYPNTGAKALEGVLGALKALQQRFPDKPVMLEEFGYPTAGRDPAAAAIEEAATVLYAWTTNLGGVMKWSLSDVSAGSNPREQSFGLYQVNGTAKPAVGAFKLLADYFAGSRQLGGKMVLADDSGGVRFSYAAGDALVVGGKQSPDARLSFANVLPTLVSLRWPTGGNLIAAATTRTALTLSPAALLADRGVGAASGQFVPVVVNGDNVSFTAEGGRSYTIPLTRAPLDAKVQIVWPQGGVPVAAADRANVGAYVFASGTQSACGGAGTPMLLRRALNNGVEEVVASGAPRATSSAGVSFTAWDFNNVDVAAARDAANRYYFRVSVDGRESHGNVWSHAVDARTYFPIVDVPKAVATTPPEVVDAKVEVVWPHGNLPVDQAEQVNIVAYVFQHGTTTAVPVDWNGVVRLWRSLNNGVEEPVGVGYAVLKPEGNLTFPVWQFDNVDVSATRDPLNKYYFRLTVDGVPAFSNIWSHGKDGRTYFPQMDTPTAAC